MYEESLMQKWDYKNGIDYAVETAVREVEEKAAERERALMKSAEEQTKLAVEKTAELEKMAFATYLLRKGLAVDFIQEATGLSLSKIRELTGQINNNN